jgi:hypothetical protein
MVACVQIKLQAMPKSVVSCPPALLLFLASLFIDDRSHGKLSRHALCVQQRLAASINGTEMGRLLLLVNGSLSGVSGFEHARVTRRGLISLKSFASLS